MFTASRRPVSFAAASRRHATIRSGLLCASALAFAAMSIPAQGRVWIVDAANGPGTNFTALPAAIDAAADGDQIRVRKGSYFTATTGKALTILGEAGAAFAASALTFEVSGLPAGRDFVLKGFASSSIIAPQVRVKNCAGRVLLDRLSLAPFPFSLTSGPAIAIENSALVTVAATTATGSPALLATASTVHVTDTDLTGGSAALTFQLQPSYPGMDVTGGSVELTNSRLVGGAGFAAAQTAAPSPALIANGTSLRVAGGTSWCVLSAGTGTTLPTPALRGTLGSLRIDPNVVLTPHLTAPKIAGTIAVQTLALPALRALGAPPAGTVSVNLFAPAGDLALLFVSPPANLLSVPAFGGDLGLDPARLFHVLTTTVGATQRLLLNVPVPNDANLRGSNWVWQGITGTVQGGFLLTNSATYTLD